MRIILKIIAAPFVLALMLIVAVLSFLSCIAGGGVLAGVYGFRPAGGLRLFRRAAYRVYRHAGVGVPCFPLWAPGHRALAAGSSVRGKIRLTGFYGELMTSGHFVQKCRAAGKIPTARFSFMGRR